MSNTKKYINIYTKAFLVLLLASFVILGSSATELHAQTDVQDCTEFANDPGALDECLQAVEEGNSSDSQSPSIEGPSETDFIIDELTVDEANRNTVGNVKNNPIYDLLLTFLNFLTAGVGLVVTTVVVVGGIEYMSAAGNPQKTQQAISRITNALIGLVLYIFMYAILQWLIPGGLFG